MEPGEVKCKALCQLINLMEQDQDKEKVNPEKDMTRVSGDDRVWRENNDRLRSSAWYVMIRMVPSKCMSTQGALNTEQSRLIIWRFSLHWPYETRVILFTNFNADTICPMKQRLLL